MAPKKAAEKAQPEPKKAVLAQNHEYEFGAVDESPEVVRLAKKLATVGKGKDALMKLLKDVKLYGALCIVQLVRVSVPDMPYDDEQLKEVFELLLECWGRLADTGSPSFEMCRGMLQTFADVMFYIPLLDLEDADLVGRTFTTLLAAARPESLDALEAPVMRVLGGMLSEMEVPPPEVVGAVMAALLGGGGTGAGPGAAGGGGAEARKGAPDAGISGGSRPPAATFTSAGTRLAAQLLPTRDNALRGAVQRRVLELVRDGARGGEAPPQPGKKAAAAAVAAAGPAGGSGGALDVFTVLNRLHASAPLLLLPVIPELKAQLQQEDEHRRAAAARLVTRLLVAPPPGHGQGQGQGPAGQQAEPLPTSSAGTGLAEHVVGLPGAPPVPMAAQYPDLLQELLRRYSDQSSFLRQHMLGRTAALAAVAAGAAPDGRLAQQASAVVRVGGELVELVGWLPGRLAQEAMRDAELRPHLMAALAQPTPALKSVVAGVGGGGGGGGGAATAAAVASSRGTGLLPPALGAQLGAEIWAALWSLDDPEGQAALRRLLSHKAKLAEELAAYVALRRQLRDAAAAAGGSSDDGARRAQRRLAVLCGELGRDAGGSAAEVGGRSAQLLLALADEGRDNHLWDRLATLAAAATATSAEAHAAALKDALSRLPNGGSKAPAADLIGRIAAAAQPSLMSPSHLAALLERIDAGGGSAAVSAETAKLAVAAAKAAPALCAGAMPRLVAMVTAEPPRPELACTTAVRMLRHAVRYCDIVGSGGDGSDGGGGPKRQKKRCAAEDADSEGDEEEGEGEGEEGAGGRASKRRCGAGGKAAAAPAARRVRGKKGAEDGDGAEGDGHVATENGGGGGGASPAASAAARAALTKALSALAVGPYGKAAKAAVHALAALHGGGAAAAGTLAALAPRLTAQLRPGRESAASTAAAIQALGSLGVVAPDVFAGHAEAFRTFVVERYLPAQLRPPPASSALTSRRYPAASPAIRLKTAALRALCRGLTPDADAPPAAAAAVPAAAAAAVTGPLEELLVRLLDVDAAAAEDDPGGGDAEYGAASGADVAALRCTAAGCLLQLAKRHDSRLGCGSYVACALAMQDPRHDVRRWFGEQVRSFLVASHQHRPPHKLARYMAMLPLAAVDPQLEHGEAAARTLREVVLIQRLTKQRADLKAAVAAAAAPSGADTASGKRPQQQAHRGPQLSDLPEFLLPHLLYILAHHPDCPPAFGVWFRRKGEASAFLDPQPGAD
ncbi:hypothetical protein GPECTOR_71g570 [Gonium pectorale]|uniref:Uncharacterized protein n=1 Tax=Gonium pectorale TaxID=33097 RepID=A0A150G2V6_GONPE|nr:hypothetical protein GPECTOR_71g570 [Gonium pectorale]|eukprot:KXZ44209.1 hypothetical protein GPECTOR_71g570 [Gonium pectorale]